MAVVAQIEKTLSADKRFGQHHYTVEGQLVSTEVSRSMFALEAVGKKAYIEIERQS